MAPDRNARGGLCAAEVLTPVLRRQVADLRHWESEVRLHRPDSVHCYRVAARRLRSGLLAFGPLLDATLCGALQEELRRTAADVGGTRDVEVIRDRIERLAVAELGPGTGATVPLLMQRLDRAQVVSWERGQDRLDSPEYDKLTRDLDAFSDLPPWLPAAGSPAEEVLGPILRAEWSRFRRRARAAVDPAGPEIRIHDARKAAKRTRYAAEALVPVLGKKARNMAKVARQVQLVLGEYQDCTIVQAFLSSVDRDEPMVETQLRVLTRMGELEAKTAAARHAEFARVFVEADRKSRRKREP